MVACWVKDLGARLYQIRYLNALSVEGNWNRLWPVRCGATKVVVLHIRRRDGLSLSYLAANYFPQM